jgi:hypothetical protein
VRSLLFFAAEFGAVAHLRFDGFVVFSQCLPVKPVISPARVRRISVAGNGAPSYSGDGGPATSAGSDSGAPLLREALPASVGHFRASARWCVNQKRGELGVEIHLAPQIGASST